MYKLLSRLVSLVIIILLSLSPIRASATLQKPDHTKATFTSTVFKVYDGDTIKLANGMEVRYLGLDTPETTIRRNLSNTLGLKHPNLTRNWSVERR